MQKRGMSVIQGVLLFSLVWINTQFVSTQSYPCMYINRKRNFHNRPLDLKCISPSSSSNVSEERLSMQFFTISFANKIQYHFIPIFHHFFFSTHCLRVHVVECKLSSSIPRFGKFIFFSFESVILLYYMG